MKTKTILASKTFWANLVALLLLLWPAARAWVSANPVDTVTALGGINVLLRWFTSGGVSLFGSDEPEEKSGEVKSGSRVLGVSAGMLLAGGLAGIGLSLPACSPASPDNLPPISARYQKDGLAVEYSSKGGVVIVVDETSGK